MKVGCSSSAVLFLRLCRLGFFFLDLSLWLCLSAGLCLIGYFSRFSVLSALSSSHQQYRYYKMYFVFQALYQAGVLSTELGTRSFWLSWYVMLCCALCSVLLYSVVLGCVLLCCVLFYSVLFLLLCSVMCFSALFCSVLFYSVLFCSVLFYFVLFCFVLFCSVLFCSVLLSLILSLDRRIAWKRTVKLQMSNLFSLPGPLYQNMFLKITM